MKEAENKDFEVFIKNLRNGSLDEVDSLLKMMLFYKHGFQPEGLKDKCPMIRHKTYEVLGYTEDSMKDIDMITRKGAYKYFEKCRKILGLDTPKYTFTKEESELLMVNGITVNKNSIKC